MCVAVVGIERVLEDVCAYWVGLCATGWAGPGADSHVSYTAVIIIPATPDRPRGSTPRTPRRTTRTVFFAGLEGRGRRLGPEDLLDVARIRVDVI